MRKFILMVLLLPALTGLKAQNEPGQYLLRGKVTDSGNNKPVAYTNIGIEGTFYGTASNEKGEFELMVPAGFSGKNIYFSAIGYKSRVLPLDGLRRNEELSIKLSPQTYGIDDVDIMAQSMVIIRILRTAAEKIPVNYVPGPFSLKGTYENEKTIDDTLNFFRKAGVTITDRTGYLNPGRLSAYRDRGYSFTNVEKNFRSYSFPDGDTGFDELLDLDWVRSGASVLNPGLHRSFDMSLEESRLYAGKPAYVISFQQMAPTAEGSGEFHGTRFEGKIYIAEDTYEVLRIEGNAEAAKQSRQGRGLAVAPENQLFREAVKSSFTVTYRSGMPELIVLNKEYRFHDRKTVERTRLAVSGKAPDGEHVAAGRDYFEGN